MTFDDEQIVGSYFQTTLTISVFNNVHVNVVVAVAFSALVPRHYNVSLCYHDYIASFSILDFCLSFVFNGVIT